jgi:hypothetical protein
MCAARSATLSRQRVGIMTKETRPARVSMAVTADEKMAVKWLAETRGCTESEVLRSTLLRDVLAEWTRVRIAA